jgi:hypothetical protein
MTATIFLEHLMGFVDEVLFPLIALWAAWQAKRWMDGSLKVPPHVHEVTVKRDE